MALDQAANFVRETVTSAISAGDTTINVADASPFPVPPEGYNIVVWDGAAYVRPDQDPDVEIMRVTDTDTTNDTLTVARGQEGTSDFNHPDTSVVVVAQTAKMIADIASEKISNPVTETVDANNNDVTNVGALDAGQIAIGGHPNLNGIEAGVVTHGDLAAATDGTWDTFESEDINVSFSTAFDSSPFVFVSNQGASDFGVSHTPRQIDVDGFTSRARNFSTSARTGSETNAFWVAVEV